MKNRNTTTQGIWPTEPTIVNFFAITDLVKNKEKVSCLLKNIKKEVVNRIAFSPANTNSFVISDHGMKWVFDVTISPNGEYGLLFSGITS